jgi:hypothetical protein
VQTTVGHRRGKDNPFAPSCPFFSVVVGAGFANPSLASRVWTSDPAHGPRSQTRGSPCLVAAGLQVGLPPKCANPAVAKSPYCPSATGIAATERNWHRGAQGRWFTAIAVPLATPRSNRGQGMAPRPAMWYRQPQGARFVPESTALLAVAAHRPDSSLARQQSGTASGSRGPSLTCEAAGRTSRHQGDCRTPNPVVHPADGGCMTCDARCLLGGSGGAARLQEDRSWKRW